MLQFISITAFYTISFTFTREELSITVFSYICSGLLVFIFINIVGLASYAGYGRLSFNESAKSLAFTCALPMSFLLFSFLDGSYLFKNLTGKKYIKYVDAVLLLAFLLVIFMTLARGLMLALAIGALLTVYLSKKRSSEYFLALIVFAMVYFAYTYVESMDMFRTERLVAYDEFETGNGRTAIWLHHFRNIVALGSQYVVFGPGPGNIARLSYTDAYAHSMILDYFFSYGVVGFLTFVIIEIGVLKKLFNKNSPVSFVIIVTFLIAYATHGGAANPSFFILQGLMVANVKGRCLNDKTKPINK
jgi:hypothetical protein